MADPEPLPPGAGPCPRHRQRARGQRPVACRLLVALGVLAYFASLVLCALLSSRYLS